MITITGRPITKKNHQKMVNGRSKLGKIYKYPIQSDAYRNYETDALWQLKKFKEQHAGPITLECRYWMPDRRGWPDLVGLLQSTQDILQKARIIDNDRNVVGYGTSCIAGIDRNNPRVEIEIREAI